MLEVDLHTRCCQFDFKVSENTVVGTFLRRFSGVICEKSRVANYENVNLFLVLIDILIFSLYLSIFRTFLHT